MIGALIMIAHTLGPALAPKLMEKARKARHSKRAKTIASIIDLSTSAMQAEEGLAPLEEMLAEDPAIVAARKRRAEARAAKDDKLQAMINEKLKEGNDA